MKKWFFLLLVLFVIAIGINFTIGQFRTKPPSPTITAGDKQIPVLQGSYCWDGLFNSVCADTSSPPDMFRNQERTPVLVLPDSPIKINFKKKPNENSLFVDKWLNNEKTESVPLYNAVFQAPKEKGVYIYSVSARWEKGDASYAFFIEIK